MTAEGPQESVCLPQLGTHVEQLAGEPLLDLGYLYRDGSHGGFAQLADLSLPGQYGEQGLP